MEAIMKWNNPSKVGINYSAFFFLENWPWFLLKNVRRINCGAVAMLAARDDAKVTQVRVKHLGSDCHTAQVQVLVLPFSHYLGSGEAVIFLGP